MPHCTLAFLSSTKPWNLSVHSQHVSVGVYELCRLKGLGTLEGGAPQEFPRSPFLLGGMWPENTEMKQGKKRTWSPTLELLRS